MLTAVILPDLSFWKFDYNNYGDLEKITLPTGGSITYSWISHGWPSADINTPVSRTVSSRTIDANDGTPLQIWQYKWDTPAARQVTVTDPLQKDTVHTFTTVVGFDDPRETKTEFYDGSYSTGTPLKTVDTQYSGSSNPFDIYTFPVRISDTMTSTNVVPTSVTTTWSNGKKSQVSYQYDTGTTYYAFDNRQGTYGTWSTHTAIYGLPVRQDDYDFGSGNVGPLLRSTRTNYQWQTNSAFLNANLLSLPASVVIVSPNSSDNSKSGCLLSVGTTGNCMAETDYFYDEPSFPNVSYESTVGALPQGTHQGVSGPRGNLTTVGRWLNTANTLVSKHTKWYDTGEPYQDIDPLLHTTTFSYHPVFAGGLATQTCLPTTGSSGHCTSKTYEFNTGLVTSSTNENATTQANGNSPGDSAHTSNFSYDLQWRIFQATAPPDPANNSQRDTTTLSYSLSPLMVTRQKSVTTGLNDSSSNYFDGLGRTFKTTHTLPSCIANVLTTFDGVGQVTSVTNPFCTTNDPTYGITQSQFDALGRATQITKQDGSIAKAQYDQLAAISANGNCTVATDETNRLRKTCSDALGRLIEVDEPGGTVSSGVQATASVAISGAFNSAWTGAGTPHLAATATAIASVTMSDGSSHNFYFDTNQHLMQLWGLGTSWNDQDLTAVTNGPLPIAGSALSAVFQSGAIHVFYQGANQHVYDMQWTGSVWQNLDMTTMTGASAMSATRMSIVLTGSPNSPMMFYEGTDQHLWTIYWNNAASAWQNVDMRQLSGATALLAPNASITSAIFPGGRIYAFYLDTSQRLLTIYWNGSAWLPADLTALSGNAPVAVAGSKMTTVATGTTIDLITYYEGAGQRIYSIYWNGSANAWQCLDFTSFSGANNFAAVVTALSSTPTGPNVFYFDSNQHLDDMNWNGSAWVNSDLTTLANTSVVAASGSSLSSHGTSAGNPLHIFFEGANQHIYHTYKTSASAWVNEDPLIVAGHNVTDTGTVSLSIPNGMSNFIATVCYGVSTNPFCAGKPINASPSDIVNALAGVLNGAGSPVNAAPSGTTLNLTWRTAGYNTATVPPITSTPDNPSLFPAGSFTSTPGTFGGGQDVGAQTLTAPLVTLYTYDTLGNLTCVEQHGGVTGTGCASAPANDATSPWRVRRFSYDSLSRLLTAKNPESGTISYTYNNDGNLVYKTSPAPNTALGSGVTETISYCYDPLHRVLAKGYSQSPAAPQQCLNTSPWLPNPAAVYAYDASTNAIGHLISMTDQAGTATYGYDVMGRLATETRTLIGANNVSISKNIAYTYNLDGSVKTLTYPSGKVITYTPDSAGRTLSAIDSGSGINYVTGATYGPDGALTGFISGSGGAAAITNSFSYNRRLQPLTMSAATSTQTVYSIGYDFHAGNGIAGNGADNGDVFGITNYKDTSRSQTFTYDALNRLTAAFNAGTDCTVTILGGIRTFWGNNYTYDAWGNLTNKSLLPATQSRPPACSGENLSVIAGSDNRLGGGYGYDVAGNMTHDATANLNYTFDQENRISAANGYGYIYDGDGNRVEKVTPPTNPTSGTLYWYMTPGIMAETDLAGTVKSEYIFFDGERVARRDGPTGAGGVFYYFSDHLKTASVITDSAGVIKAESDYNPWGGELPFVANDTNDYKFTGKKRDTETGLDYFGARYYSNGLGRWVSADWSATPVPVPYASFGDPQSLNQYSYVRNMPTTGFDLDGHQSYGSRGETGIICRTCIQAGVEVILNPKQAGRDAWQSVKAFGQSLANLLPYGDNKPSPSYKPPEGPQPANSAVGKMTTVALTVATLKLPVPKSAAVVDMTQAAKIPSVIKAAEEGQAVYRVWGNASGPFGHSWTPVNPGTVANFRDAAGLPNVNSGEWTSVGTLTDATGVVGRDALPLDGNVGGLPELLVPNARTQIAPRYSIRNDPPH
jgi:RHS repeat-associated protein